MRNPGPRDRYGDARCRNPRRALPRCRLCSTLSSTAATRSLPPWLLDVCAGVICRAPPGWEGARDTGSIVPTVLSPQRRERRRNDLPRRHCWRFGLGLRWGHDAFVTNVCAPHVLVRAASTGGHPKKRTSCCHQHTEDSRRHDLRLRFFYTVVNPLMHPTRPDISPPRTTETESKSRPWIIPSSKEPRKFGSP